MLCILFQYRDLDLADLGVPVEMRDGGTVAPEKRELQTEQPKDENGQAEGLSEAAGGVPIDENLFADEDDLDDLEEELEELDVND